MQQVLILFTILTPLTSAFPPHNFIDNASISNTPGSNRVILTEEEFQGRHPCAADGVCDCWYDEDYDWLDKWVVVDCSERNLTEAPKSLIGLDHPVGELYLHGNRLTRTPDMTRDGYETVFALTLFGNRIKSIVEETISPNLKILFLGRNRISRIDVEVLRKLKNLRGLAMFTIGSNPLRCDCRSMASLEILRTINVHGRDTATCGRTKIKISDLKIDELCSNTTATLPSARKNEN